MITTNMPWNKRLKLLRIANELTQKALAAKIGVHLRVYQRWEKGENVPRLFMQKCIADALGVEQNDIYDKGEKD